MKEPDIISVLCAWIPGLKNIILTFRSNQLYYFIQYKNASLIKPKHLYERSGLALKEASLSGIALKL
jgi:hypothetical protein